MSDKKYLVIGSTGHQFVECIEWNHDPLPNIVDYDIIIINVCSLTDDFLRWLQEKEINEFRILISRFLFSGGVLIVLSDFLRSVQRLDYREPPGPTEINSNYFWCPIDFSIVKESGNTIIGKKENFPGYFSEFKKWDYYFRFNKKYPTDNSLSQAFHGQVKIYPIDLLSNRYDEILSSYIEFLVTKNGKWTSSGGKIVFLPLLVELDSKNATNLLLEDLIGKPQIPLPPSWVSKIKMPFIAEYNSKLADILSNIDKLKSQYSKIDEEKRNIESYKKLIYSDGLDLEDIFKRCIKELGGEIIPEKYSEEEFGFVYKGIECLVEAKGISKSVSLTHLRQLIDYLLKYEEKTGKECKGILLGNPWKNKPLQERNTEKKPNFPTNVIKRANDMNISLVSSVDFFKIFCKFLEGKVEGQKVLDKIINTKGLVKFK